MADKLEVKVPDIGSYSGVPVIEILVKEGDAVEKDAPLIVLESDKSTMEVPAPAAGTVRGIKVKMGDKVSQGDAICALETANAVPTVKAEPPKPVAAPKPVPAAAPAPVPAPAPAAASATIAVTVPDIGNYSNIPVIEVFVKDGDRVEKDASLLTLESEKATMDVPAPASGVVRGFRLKVGDKVSRGVAICTLEGVTAAAAPAVAPAPPPAPAKAAEAPKPAPQAVAATATAVAAPRPGELLPYASPSVRKFARELGVDLSKVKGGGPRGRILQDDVQNYVKQSLAAPAVRPPSAAGLAGIPPIPAVDFSLWGEIETKPLARIRKLSAQHLHRAWLNVPHVTQNDEADITELEAFRKTQSEESAVKLTLLPFVMKAVSVVMKQYPEFNASLAPDGESLILKKYCNIGFAADTPNGLVVPVVKDVWSKGIVQLGTECADLAKKARDGKLKLDEMKGGCFSVSSLGGIGGSHFTPIVNAPEVAILGVSRGQMKPVWDGKTFVPRLMLPLSLSYDHRVIDGANAARFIVSLVKLLSDLRRLTL